MRSERRRKRRMEKNKKIAVLAVGGVLIAVLAVFVMMSVMRGRREIDQKILIIYRLQMARIKGNYSENVGYYIDNEGKERTFELSSDIESDEEVLEILMKEPSEKQKRLHRTDISRQLFSEKEVAKLYDWLYKIDASCEIERTQDHPKSYRFRILGVRYKEDGEAEIITIFEAGEWDGNNPDRYAQKVRKAVLKKKPIRIRPGVYYSK